jgi:hypothetical protein
VARQYKSRQSKYRALVHLDPDTADSSLPHTGGRVVVRAKHHDTHRSKMFSALVSSAPLPDVLTRDHSVELTMTVLGEDVVDYLEAGDTFALWRGHDIGQGLISRRLHLWVDGP